MVEEPMLCLVLVPSDLRTVKRRWMHMQCTSLSYLFELSRSLHALVAADSAGQGVQAMILDTYVDSKSRCDVTCSRGIGLNAVLHHL